MDLKLIAQEHSLGCGVACVASLLGLSYQEALAKFPDSKNAYIRGFYCRELVGVLRAVGLDYQYEKFKTTKHSELLVQSGVIVFTKKDAHYLFGHYWLKTKRGWMNPWANSPSIKNVKATFRKTTPKNISWIIFSERKQNLEL